MAERQLWPQLPRTMLGALLLAVISLLPGPSLAQFSPASTTQIRYPPITLTGPSGTIKLGSDVTIVVRSTAPYPLPNPVTYRVEQGQQFVQTTSGTVTIAPGATSALFTLATTGSTGSAGQGIVYLTARNPSMDTPYGFRFQVQDAPTPTPDPPPQPDPVPFVPPASTDVTPAVTDTSPAASNGGGAGGIVASPSLNPSKSVIDPVAPLTDGPGTATSSAKPDSGGTDTATIAPGLGADANGSDPQVTEAATNPPDLCQTNPQDPACSNGTSTRDVDWSDLLLKLALVVALMAALWVDFLLLVRPRWHFMGLSAQGAAIRMDAVGAPDVWPEVTATAHPAELVGSAQITELQETGDGLDI